VRTPAIYQICTNFTGVHLIPSPPSRHEQALAPSRLAASLRPSLDPRSGIRSRVELGIREWLQRRHQTISQFALQSHLSVSMRLALASTLIIIIGEALAAV
jgi:hypothetical protein